MTQFNKLLPLVFICLCFVSVKADWEKVNSNSFAWFHSVYFIDQKKGWIVGSRGTFLETDDGGATWKTLRRITEDTIRDVYFADQNKGWILCERNLFEAGDASPSSILETNNGGETWEKVDLNGQGNERLVRFFFSGDGFGRAVGETGAFFAMQDDKKTWVKTTLPVRFLLLDGSFFDQTSGLVVGGGGTALFTEDGGKSWNKANFSNQTRSKLNSVFFINQKVGWAVGAEGKIYSTINGGRFWREQNSTIKNDLFDVMFLNTAEGWAIGENGTMLYTATAGNIWSAVQSTAKHKLERIFFVGEKGWAVGFGGTILRYEKANRETNPPKATPLLQKRSYSAES